MLKIALYGLLGAAALALTAVLAARPLGARLKAELERSVAEACAPCELRVGSAALGLLPPRVELGELSFRQGDPRDSAVRAEAGRVEVPIPWSNLGGGAWRIGLVRVTGLHVLVHEGDLSLRKEERPGRGGEEPRRFEAEGIAVSDSSFTYRKDSPAGAAYLRLTGIAADIGPFGSTEALRREAIEGAALARLEGSGEVALRVDARLNEDGPWADVHLRVKGQKLREVNAYFRPEEGVTLAGVLLDSESSVKVRGARADGVVMARYEGLEVKFHRNRHRGALGAILNNLGARIKVNRGNSGEPRSERESAVVTRRHAKESVVSFILRTLKEAVLRVAA